MWNKCCRLNHSFPIQYSLATNSWVTLKSRIDLGIEMPSCVSDWPSITISLCWGSDRQGTMLVRIQITMEGDNSSRLQLNTCCAEFISGNVRYIFVFSIISEYYDGIGSWNPSSSMTKTCLSCEVNFMVADGLGVVSLTFRELPQDSLSKFVYCRNHTSYENFKLKLCTCAQSHALGTCTKFQLEILTINLNSGIVYFRKIILRSSWNVSETTPWSDTDIPVTCSMTSHYPNQCGHVVDCTLRNEKFSFYDNAFQMLSAEWESFCSSFNMLNSSNPWVTVTQLWWMFTTYRKYMTGEFPTQKASNAENVSIWWRHHEHGNPYSYKAPWYWICHLFSWCLHYSCLVMDLISIITKSYWWWNIRFHQLIYSLTPIMLNFSEKTEHINGLVQDCSISSVLASEAMVLTMLFWNIPISATETFISWQTAHQCFTFLVLCAAKPPHWGPFY